MIVLKVKLKTLKSSGIYLGHLGHAGDHNLFDSKRSSKNIQLNE